MTNTYKLTEIANWQSELSDEKHKITLPELQRGFVWKPSQIEQLWDSILRGYPIGSILMSESENEKFLLDGQQRCTSIALGFYDPFGNRNFENFLSLKSNIPTVWIDLKPEKLTTGYKYAVRVLTRSHPWGYKLTNNIETLSMGERKAALAFFNEKKVEKKYTELNNAERSPWDAHFPIPLAFLMETKTDSESNWIKEVLTRLDKFLNGTIKTQYSKGEFVDYSDLESTLKQLYIPIQNAQKRELPEIVVDTQVLKEDDSQDDNAQEPTLFVRLNSAGTRISGEELNYSIYKAYFPESKQLVENIGRSFIAPSKLVSIYSRICLSELNNDSFPAEIKVKDFQKQLKNEAFKTSLIKLIQSEVLSQNDSLVEKAIRLLTKEGDSSLPPIVLKQLISNSIDLFTLLLCYLKKNHDQLNDKVASNYVAMVWFTPDLKKLVREQLWTRVIVQKSRWDTVMKELLETKNENAFALLEPNAVRNFLLENVIKRANNRYEIEQFDLANENQHIIYEAIITNPLPDLSETDKTQENQFAARKWNSFISKIVRIGDREKSILIYAQRKYFNSKFQDFNQFESTEDTNRPWDWDHIYPHSWVYDRNSIHPLIKHWVNCIGNFRGLSYDDNRSENNHFSPSARFKLDEKVLDSFVTKSNLDLWKLVDDKYKGIKHDDIDKAKIVLVVILNRSVDIYEEWYRNYYL